MTGTDSGMPLVAGLPGTPRGAAWPSIAAWTASAPLRLLFAPLLILTGVAILAWDYALLPADPLDHVLYWLGFGCVYAGVVALGALGRPTSRRQLVALAALGAVMWLPYYLRSPDRLVFVDELYHRDVAARILDTGHAIGLPVTLYPLPGNFPGLESLTIAVMGATGLGLDGAIRVVTLAIHATIPCLAYLVARGVGLGARGAFVAALVYASNTSFAFFHSVFSYETLGVLQFLAVWALVAWYRAAPADGPLPTRRRRLVLVVAAVPLLLAISLTHHVSSYALAITLLVGWVALRVQRSPTAPAVRDLALLCIVFDTSWFLLSSDRVGTYLGSSIGARVDTIVSSLLLDRSQPRALFANVDQPQLERLLAFSYPPLVLGLVALGLWVAWQRPRRPALLLPLALIGPVAWVVSTPAVFTRSGEIAYRAWPFLFMGVSVFAALALLEVARRVGRRWPSAGGAVAFGLVGILLFGGISIGENQAGRFPTAPRTAAGGAANSADVVAAAEWLRTNAGESHLVATDVGTAVPFATEGRQRILSWASWYPFVVGDPSEIAAFVRETDTEYLVLDRRITSLPPRYGSYFGAPPIPDHLEPGAPIPPDLVGTFDAVPVLRRVYAGPNIVIYRVDLARANGGEG